MRMWEIKLPGPNPENGLRGMRCSGKRGFKDSVARWGVSWAGTPRVVTMGSSASRHASPSPSSSLSENKGLTIFLNVTWIYYSPRTLLPVLMF